MAVLRSSLLVVIISASSKSYHHHHLPNTTKPPPLHYCYPLRKATCNTVIEQETETACLLPLVNNFLQK